MNIKKWLVWALVAFVIFVFVQSLFFKFAGLQETEIIFSTIAQWMGSITGLNIIAPFFEVWGGYTIGAVELIAALLLLFPGTRRLGAFIGLVIISGAIFFHLFTPLGVDRIVNEAGDTDSGVLFYMACGVWVCCALILLLTKKKIKVKSAYR
ncbi:MAG: hypothetical protein KTR16_13500 [Acidiferrobacterales bacterium]|nr:hypothetical protein [Acidiferrobacterales bacterium]